MKTIFDNIQIKWVPQANQVTPTLSLPIRVKVTTLYYAMPKEKNQDCKNFVLNVELIKQDTGRLLVMAIVFELVSTQQW